MKEQMAEPKHGRTYRRSAITRAASGRTRALGLRERTTKKGRKLAIVGFTFHRASAPGEAPAIDTGQASNSLAAQPVVVNASGIRGQIIGSEILQLLDEGTSRIAPRPFVEAALERAREPFIRDCNEAVEALL